MLYETLSGRPPFDPESGVKPSKYQFMPFGAGAKRCIGASLAMIQLTLLLANLIRHASFRTREGFDPKPTARQFLRPVNGMPMQVQLRD